MKKEGRLDQPEEKEKIESAAYEPAKSSFKKYAARLIISLFICIIFLFPVAVLAAFPLPLMSLFFGTIMLVVIFNGINLLRKRSSGAECEEEMRIFFSFSFQVMAIICLYTFSRAVGDILGWFVVGKLYMGYPVNEGSVYPAIVFGTYCIFVAGGYTYLDVSWRNRQMRQLENLPTSKIRSAAIGLVELKGRAAHYGEGESPYVLTSTAVGPFYLEDDTGRVLVDPAGCKVRDDWYWFSAINNTVFGLGGMPGLRELVLRYRPVPTSRRDGGVSVESYYYVVEPSDELYVIGNLEMRSDAPEGATGPEALVVRAKKRPPMGEAFFGALFGKLDYTNVFFVTDSDEEEAMRAIKRGRRVSLVIGVTMVLGGLFVLFEGIWGLGKLGG